MADKTINAKRIKELINYFCSLSFERQTKVMEFVYRELLDQRAEETLRAEHKPVNKDSIENLVYDRVMTMDKLGNLADSMNESEKAALLMMLESLVPGMFTKEEDISVNIRERTVSIEQYIKSIIPQADIKEAETMSREWIEKTKTSK